MADPADEHHVKPPAAEFDTFLLKAWKLEKLPSYRNPLAEWNELVHKLVGTISPEERDALELSLLPHVVRYIDEYGENKMSGYVR